MTTGPHPISAIVLRARWLIGASVATALSMAPGLAHADPLRCGGSSVSEGDSKLTLLRVCGQPTLTDQFCVKAWSNRRPRPPYDDPAQGGDMCIFVEEWLYERGPGDLPAVVRIREGRVISIRFGNTK